MKLDRNQNPDGRGKYALVKMRKVDWGDTDVACALSTLNRAGLIQWGNESPGDQFFVMKYKDRFTADALTGYARSIRKHLGEVSSARNEYRELREFMCEILIEAAKARRLGNRIPD